MDTVFFLVSKVFWLFVRPETLLVAGYGVALALLWRQRIRAATRVLAATLVITLLIGVVPIGNFILSPLEQSYPANPSVESVAGIIVLGGSEYQGPSYADSSAQVNEAGDRLITAFSLARQFPQALVLYSGGKTVVTPAESGEYELGPDILRELGLPEGRLLVEGRSRTTAENAVFSRALVDEDLEGAWVLVTSAFHMPRAVASFCSAGWRALVPYPTDYRTGVFWDKLGWRFAGNLDEMNLGVKEWIGMLGYRLTGRIGTLFPTRCD